MAQTIRISDRLAMKLLVSTPSFVLGFDTQTKKVDVLSSGISEYYGITWDPSGQRLALSHSGTNSDSLVDISAYAQSERGHISIDGKPSLQGLSAPHQILWIDDDWIVATNTGRNAIAKMRVADTSVVQYRYSQAIWDRLTPDGQEGEHYNSFFYQDGLLYVVAHNFTKGSFILTLDWPSMREVDRMSVPASGIHNFWIDPHGRWITCDSNNSAIIDANTGEVRWTNGQQGYLRGLAATDRLAVVGCTPFKARHERTKCETGLWLFDPNTWETLDYFHLGHFGGVNDVRIIDLPDLCHNGVPLSPDAVHGLAAAGNKIAADRLRGVKAPDSASRNWSVQIGTSDILGQRVIRPKAGDFFLATLTNDLPEVSGLTADLHIGRYWQQGDYAGLVACFHGPDDQNMIAALFQRTMKGELTASLWREQGGWKSVERTTVADSIWRPHGGRPSANEANVLKLELRAANDLLELLIGGATILSLPVSAADLDGACGVRMLGASFGISDVRLTPKAEEHA